IHRDGAWGAGSRARRRRGASSSPADTRGRSDPQPPTPATILTEASPQRCSIEKFGRRCCAAFPPRVCGSLPVPWSTMNEAGAMSNDSNIAGTYQVSPAAGYTGDVAPATAWKILSERKDAVLIDVRTRAEWNYVGLPDLDPISKKPALLEWQVFPSMQPNPDFVSALASALANKDAPLLFICRSGAR